MWRKREKIDKVREKETVKSRKRNKRWKINRKRGEEIYGQTGR